MPCPGGGTAGRSGERDLPVRSECFGTGAGTRGGAFGPRHAPDPVMVRPGGDTLPAGPAYDRALA
jgi:hypothetical protein